jgi:hypothetical protein
LSGDNCFEYLNAGTDASWIVLKEGLGIEGILGYGDWQHQAKELFANDVLSLSLVFILESWFLLSPILVSS